MYAQRNAQLNLTFLALLMAMVCIFQLERALAIPSGDPLQTFLQNYLRQLGIPDDKTTQYFDTSVDLNGDGKNEVVVYISGRNWRGTGGCPTLILARKGDSFKVVTTISITRPPIRVLNSQSTGCR